MEPNNIGLRLPVARADKRFFSLRQSGGESQEPWGLVSDVRVREGSTIITLRGILQVGYTFRQLSLLSTDKKIKKQKMCSREQNSVI